MESIISNLIKNAYPPFLIDKVIKRYLNYNFSSNQNQLKDTSGVHYFKLPYIGNLSHNNKNNFSKRCKEFCTENVNIKLALTSFKIKNYFSYKGPIPDDLKSFLVYKFTCVRSSSSYIGETYHNFKTRIEEHIKWITRFSSHPFTIASVPLSLFFFCFFCVSLSSIIFISYGTNYRHLLLSLLHFPITSSHYNTPCITPFSFIY